MRLIKMTGGLGNQMFIYAFYLQMRRRYADTRIDLSDMAHYDAHNGYELHRVFPQLEAEEVLWPQGLKKVVEFLFFRTVLERKQRPDTLRPFERRRLWPLTYFKGFYQSERHFAGVADEVRRAFTFDEGLAGKRTRALLEQIRADGRAVSLHVRRGDYLEPRTWRNTGCVCGEAYYRDAVERMAQLAEEPHYYVFSDDIAWVRENIPTPPFTTYVDWNRGPDSWQDMMLMAACRHNVVCNSTFSWWGAWLNAHKDKHVVAPARWSALAETPYICPPEWTLIDIKLPAER